MKLEKGVEGVIMSEKLEAEIMVVKNIPHELIISPNSKQQVAVCNMDTKTGPVLCRPEKWPLKKPIKNRNYYVRWYCYNCQKFVKPKVKGDC